MRVKLEGSQGTVETVESKIKDIEARNGKSGWNLLKWIKMLKHIKMMWKSEKEIQHMYIWILEEIEWGNRYKGITQGNYFWHKNKYTHT